MLPLILPLLILLSVGLPFVWTVIKFMNSPIVSGTIPVWAIAAIGLVALWVYKNRHKWGLVKQQPAPPRYY